MSITDELREYANTRISPNKGMLTAIADRIDAEHEEAIQQVLIGEGGVPATDENMAEHGWIRLPVDADGEYIHIGDEMEGVDKYDTLKEVRGKVITVSFESDGIVDVAIQAWNSDGRSWRRAYLDPDASVYRHHQPDTWERIIRDALGARWTAPDELSLDYDALPTFDALVARCRALAGESDA